MTKGDHITAGVFATTKYSSWSGEGWVSQRGEVTRGFVLRVLTEEETVCFIRWEVQEHLRSI